MKLDQVLSYPLDRETFYTEYPNYHLAHPSVVLTTFIGYGLVCLYVAVFLKNRAPIHVPRWVLVLHNLIQVALSFVMVAGLLFCIYNAGYSFTGNYIFDPRRTSVYDQGVTAIIRLFTLSKHYDLVDTLFIILMKKDSQFTFLHCSHHAIVPIAVWYGMWYSPSGDSYAPCLVNSFVHLVMYSYYLCSTLHISCPWKHLITQLQLSQFAFLCLFGINCYRIGSIAWQTSAVNTAVQVAMMVMFGQFYLVTYRKSAAAGPKHTARVKAFESASS